MSLQEIECVNAIGSDEDGESFRFKNKPQSLAESEIGCNQNDGLGLCFPAQSNCYLRKWQSRFLRSPSSASIRQKATNPAR